MGFCGAEAVVDEAVEDADELLHGAVGVLRDLALREPHGLEQVELRAARSGPRAAAPRRRGAPPVRAARARGPAHVRALGREAALEGAARVADVDAHPLALARLAARVLGDAGGRRCRPRRHGACRRPCAASAISIGQVGEDPRASVARPSVTSLGRPGLPRPSRAVARRHGCERDAARLLSAFTRSSSGSSGDAVVVERAREQRRARPSGVISKLVRGQIQSRRGGCVRLHAHLEGVRCGIVRTCRPRVFSTRRPLRLRSAS